MPYIKVNTQKLDNYSSEIASCKSRVSYIMSSFSSCYSTLDWDVKCSSNITSKVNNIINGMQAEINSLEKMERFLSATSEAYTYLDGEAVKSETVMSMNSQPSVVETVEFTEAETEEIISQLADETGMSVEKIKDQILEGLDEKSDLFGKIEKIAAKTGKFARVITGVPDLLFKFKNGQVIVSKFTRSSLLNNITKFFHGKGIATHYKPSTLIKTPGVGTIYAIDKIAKGVEIAAGAIQAGISFVEAGTKISAVLADPTKSKYEKENDVAAIGITTAASMALDVAAPIVGNAVKAAIPIPGVNFVVGAAAKFVVSTAAEVVKSEAVVKQVSESVGNVRAAGKATSEAGKALLKSKSVGEAVKNTARLVGSAVKTVQTIKTEVVKVAAKVVAETGKAIANKVAKAAKSVAKIFKGW